MKQYVVNGLDLQPMDDIARDIADMGYNCVRLVYSESQFVDNPIVEEHLLEKNPQFKGKSSEELFYETVDAVTEAGLMVIINSHNSDAMWCCAEHDNNGFWWNEEYPEEVWLQTLEKLTYKFKDVPLVVGNDIRNELRRDN